MTSEKVLFYPVRDNNAKLRRIYQTAAEHFQKKEALQIVVPDKTALEFVDALLWRLPKESFLPHTASSALCNDLIVISTERALLNKPAALFNLCPGPLIECKAKLLYDLEDYTSPEKRLASEKRYLAYRQAGLQMVTAT